MSSRQAIYLGYSFIYITMMKLAISIQTRLKYFIKLTKGHFLMFWDLLALYFACLHFGYRENAWFRSNASSASTVLSSATPHRYRGKFDWQNLVFMNMHEAGETNLLPMKLHVTIKYSSITMTSYWDLSKIETNAHLYFHFEW